MKPNTLKRFALFADFTDEDREHMNEMLDIGTFSPGEQLFCEGEEADTMLLILSGSVRIHSQSAGRLGLLCQGANLGCLSLVTIGRREVTAVAEAETTVAILDRAGFLRLAEDHPRAACRLAEAMLIDLATTLRRHLPYMKQQFSSDEVVHSG